MMNSNRTERLKVIAADMFYSEGRRGYLANNCSVISPVDPNISEEEYIERFVEWHRDADLNKLEEIADIVRPSNMPTAFEREAADNRDAMRRKDCGFHHRRSAGLRANCSKRPSG